MTAKRALARVALGVVFAIVGAWLAPLAIGAPIEWLCSTMGVGLLSWDSPTCRLLGDYENNGTRQMIDLLTALVGAAAGIWLVVKRSRKNVQQISDGQ